MSLFHSQILSTGKRVGRETPKEYQEAQGTKLAMLDQPGQQFKRRVQGCEQLSPVVPQIILAQQDLRTSRNIHSTAGKSKPGVSICLMP